MASHLVGFLWHELHVQQFLNILRVSIYLNILKSDPVLEACGKELKNEHYEEGGWKIIYLF